MQTFTTALMGFLILSGSSTAASTALVATSTFAPVPREVTLAREVPELETYSVSMTGYNAVPGQTDEDPFTTASGAFSDPDVVAARSADLADELPFGTVIEIVPNTSTTTPSCGLPLVEDHIGYRVIADTMNARMRNKVDILFHSDDAVRVRGRYLNPARALGVCKNVQIRVVGRIDVSKVPHTQEQLKIALGKAQLAVNK